MGRYFEALEREIRLTAGEYDGYEVQTIFFGGGTPSFPGEKYVCRVLSVIRECYDVSGEAEISIEVNPASAIHEKLVAYREAGFNRISIGVQSLNDDELKVLGRLHDSETAIATVEEARAVGFQNINVDIMSALPGQNLESYLSTLERVAELEPEHISAYSLIVEDGTPFHDMELKLPDEVEDRLMYHETKRLLSQHGYSRYEISNYAHSGFECRHNIVYWRRGNYLGFGLGSASMVENVRWNNKKDMDIYLKVCEETDGAEKFFSDLRENVEALSTKSQMEEFMFLGLRLCEGVSTDEFEKLFGKSIFDVYGQVIAKYESMELLHRIYRSTESGTQMYLALTDSGMDVSNTVMADFLL